MADTETFPQQNMYEKVEQVNAILQAQEPENISVDTYGGYTGYKPQYIINAMNRVFGLGKWGFKEISSETRNNAKGEESLVVAKVQVWIDGVNWQPEVWGQNRVTKGDIGDADKGANTDGMKKGLSYFSIGSRAFEGKLSADDAQQYKDEQKVQALRRKQEAQEQARTVNRSDNTRERANGNTRQQEQAAKPAQQATNAAPRSQSARTQPAPVAPVAKPVEQPANGNAPRPVPLDTIKTVADKKYPGGWIALKEKIAEKFNILGEVSDELIGSDYNTDAQAFIKDAMKQPAVVGATSGK